MPNTFHKGWGLGVGFAVGGCRFGQNNIFIQSAVGEKAKAAKSRETENEKN